MSEQRASKGRDLHESDTSSILASGLHRSSSSWMIPGLSFCAQAGCDTCSPRPFPCERNSIINAVLRWPVSFSATSLSKIHPVMFVLLNFIWELTVEKALQWFGDSWVHTVIILWLRVKIYLHILAAFLLRWDSASSLWWRANWLKVKWIMYFFSFVLGVGECCKAQH